jgi:hypothetical protein
MSVPADRQLFAIAGIGGPGAVELGPIELAVIVIVLVRGLEVKALKLRHLSFPKISSA